ASDPRLRPRLRVSYADDANTTALSPLADTWLSCSTVGSLGDQQVLKAGGDERSVLEFDLQPITGRRIAKATLELNQLRYESAAVIGVYALDPPIVTSPNPEAEGISRRYPRDVGIERDPEVVFATGFESPFWRSEWSYLSPGSHAETLQRD